MARTNKEIVEQTHKLAVEFYLTLGCRYEGSRRLYDSPHPTEQAMWKMACIAQEMLTGTDPENCLAELEDEVD